MNAKDTTRQANEVIVDAYRRMPSTVKIFHIFEAYRMGRALAIAGLRQLHPDAGEKEIRRLWAKQHLGEKLFNDVYGEPADG